MPDASESSQTFPNGAAQTAVILQRLGEMRDGLLVLAAVFYGAGYLAWNMFAWIYGLGTAPPLDAQYFLIGTPLVVGLAALGYLIHTIVRRLLPDLASWSRSRPKRVRLLVALILGAWVLVRTTAYVSNKNQFPQALIYASLLMLYVVYGSIISILFRPSTLGRNAASVSLIVVVTTLLGIAIAAYVLSLYRYIPQQIGGGKLRPARIEVRSDTLSPELLEELGCKPDVSGAVVRRTRILWLLIGAGDTLIIVDGPDLLYARGRVEIPRSSVSAILWQ